MGKISGFLTLLGVLFIVFKITGIITWGWFAVIAPLAVVLILAALKVGIAVLIACGVIMEREGIMVKLDGKTGK